MFDLLFVCCENCVLINFGGNYEKVNNNLNYTVRPSLKR